MSAREDISEEIEVTPAMVEAGKDVAYRDEGNLDGPWSGDSDREQLAVDIYLAMRKVALAEGLEGR